MNDRLEEIRECLAKRKAAINPLPSTELYIAHVGYLFSLLDSPPVPGDAARRAADEIDVLLVPLRNYAKTPSIEQMSAIISKYFPAAAQSQHAEQLASLDAEVMDLRDAWRGDIRAHQDGCHAEFSNCVPDDCTCGLTDLRNTEMDEIHTRWTAAQPAAPTRICKCGHDVAEHQPWRENSSRSPCCSTECNCSDFAADPCLVAGFHVCGSKDAELRKVVEDYIREPAAPTPEAAPDMCQWCKQPIITAYVSDSRRYCSVNCQAQYEAEIRRAGSNWEEAAPAPVAPNRKLETVVQAHIEDLRGCVRAIEESEYHAEFVRTKQQLVLSANELDFALTTERRTVEELREALRDLINNLHWRASSFENADDVDLSGSELEAYERARALIGEQK